MDSSKTIVDIQTGEVKSGDREMILKSSGIGSCIVVAALDVKHCIGAVAHLMLPGTSPDSSVPECTRYAHNGIQELLEQMKLLGSSLGEDMRICTAGGANVLMRDDDSICRENIESVRSILESRNLPVSVESLGGIHRRSLTLDIENSTVWCSIGDDGNRILYREGLTG